MLEQLASTNSQKVKILKVDVHDNPGWAQSEQVKGIPHVQLYMAGHKLHEFSGAPTKSEFQKKITHFAAVTAETAAAGPVAPPEPAIQPMPKDWLPPGITRKKKPTTE